MATMTESQVHLWTRAEYYKMAEAGLFAGKHVELIEGCVIEMSPMGSLHATAVALAGRTLERVFGPDYFARWQMPLRAGDLSEPELDIAVIRGDVRAFKEAHPTTAALIVEVSDTSLTYDRTEKASFYARIGIGDYWVVNLVDRQLEVFRDPVPDAAERFGFRYAKEVIFKPGEVVSPSAQPEARVAVEDLLP